MGPLVFTFLIAFLYGGAAWGAEEGRNGTLEEGDCPFGVYGANLPNNCICLSQGLWGVSKEYCKSPSTLLAVRTRFCFINRLGHSVDMLSKLLSLEVPEVAQLSSSMNKLVDRFDNFTTVVPFPEDVYQEESTLVTYGRSKWTVRTVKNETYCLLHNGSALDQYCIFPHLRHESKSVVGIREISPECRHHEIPTIVSSQCLSLEIDKKGCDDDTLTSSQQPQLPSLDPVKEDAPLTEVIDNSLVKKRGMTDSEEESSETTSPTPDEDVKKTKDRIQEDPSWLLTEDEDEIQLGRDEIGHELMRDQMDQYVDRVVAQLTGLSANDSSKQNEGGGDEGAKAPSEGPYPVHQLLHLIKMIMQKTCSAVKSEYFELALNTFLKVQFQSFHVKEPFLPHNSYRRISYALKRCYNEAKAHTFHQPTDTSSKNCPQSGVTSGELDVYGNGSQIVKLEKSSDTSSAFIAPGVFREPLTETVWKMLVNAHSYCYPYFKAYFNDHHALTVALLPLFNNQIQDIWLKSEGYDSSKGQLYGGLLGDTTGVLEDVDNCVGASRTVSQYPWYMSRPMKDWNNKWRKRKRRFAPSLSNGTKVKEDTGFLTDQFLAPQPIFLSNGNRLCMFDPDDPVAFLGKPVCS